MPRIVTQSLIGSAFAALLASFAAVMPAARAAPFIVDAAELRRLDDDGTRPVPADSRKLAVTSDGGAWIGVGTHVRRVSQDGESVGVAIGDSDWGAIEHVVVDPHDDSVWVATDASLLLHYSPSGELGNGTTLPARVEAMTVAMDDSVWVVANRSLLQFSSTGTQLRSQTLGIADRHTFQWLAVDSLRERIWIGTSGAIYRVDASDLDAPAVTAVTGIVRTMALETRSGRLWTIADGRLVVLDIDTRAVEERRLPREELLDLAYDANDDAVIVQTTESVWRLHAADAAVKLRDLREGAMLSTMPLRIEPRLRLVRPPDGGAMTNPHDPLILQADALCNGVACSLGSDYFRGARVHATVNGLGGARADIEIASGRITLLQAPLRTGMNNVAARFVDRFGHSTALDDSHVWLLDGAVGLDSPSKPDESGVRIPKAPNKPPSVQLTAPTSGASFPTGAAITLTANASDADGSIARVEFYRAGTTLLGSATTSPYRYVWASAPTGTHALTAKAYDNKGATTTSASVSIAVLANQPPTVTLTSPVNGDFVAVGAPVALAAIATDPDGTIAKVEFIAGGSVVGVATNAPYTHSWNGPAGTHAIMARATDDKGATANSAAVNVVIGEAPIAVVTSPRDCMTLESPQDILLEAQTLSATGRVVSVAFYDGSTLVATVNASPWRAGLIGPTPGTHAITARATDDHGLTTVSRPAHLTVKPLNVPPSVAMTSPPDGTHFPLGSTVNLLASASDDVAVASVEFHLDGPFGTFLGRATSAPYAMAWSGMGAATYSVVAVATDDRGAWTTSSTVRIAIDPNVAPSVALTSPANGASFSSPATIPLTATASDSDGSIARVDFYAGTMLIGSSASAPYSATWANVAAGTYWLTAKAIDNGGAVSSSAAASVTVSSNAAPVIALDAPSPPGPYFAPALIRLGASASDADGTITRVEFRANGTLIGTATSSPYAVSWNDVASGTYSVTAIATDDRGATTTSAATVVVVNSGIAIDAAAGLDGSVVDDDTIVISGTINAPANSGVLINGTIAQVDGAGHFYANGVLLLPGANTVAILVASFGGQTATKTLTISSTGAAPFAVEAAPTDGLAPLDVLFAVTNRGNRAFQRMEFDFESDGVADYIAYPAQFVDGKFLLAVTYPAGTYTMKITAYDADNVRIWSTTRIVTARSTQQLDGMLRGVYDGMLQSLVAGRIDLALNAISGDMQDKYQAVFTEIGTALPAAISTLGTLEPNWFGVDRAEYFVIRDTSDGKVGFLIDFIRGEDGVWRIDGM
ncbi:MAG TPA: Ig-like domain-containing protein [Gemmatimonadaceae bacterium]|nr:Ig-like domain-containing protein [Gemmatimonadaceae bacterium]